MAVSSSPSAASPALRASDADREHVAAALRRHHLDGRLDTDELQERLGACYAARTLGQLEPLLADLPGAARPAARARRGGAPPPARGAAAPRRGRGPPPPSSPSWPSSSCSRRSARSPTAGPARSRSSGSSCSSAARGGAPAAAPRGAPVAERPVPVALQRGLQSLAMALIAAQFFLAGAGAFGATSFDAHKTVGSVLVLVALLGLLAAGLARRFVGHAALFLGATVLQLVLGTLGADTPWIGAFHGLNAVVVVGVGGALARRAWAGPEGATAAAAA